MARENDSPGLTVAIVLGCLVLGGIILGGGFDKKPTPAPSPTPTVTTTPSVMVPRGYVAEDDPRWSCRIDGDTLCGDTPRWTWGIGLYA